MTPHCAQLVNPTFEAVIQLLGRIQRGERLRLEDERARLRGELQTAEMKSAAAEALAEIRPEEFQLIQRCLIYWIDEVMTQAAPEWKEMLLEVEYFQERERAWRFYVFGENQARRCSSNVVEVWYLALALGFEGDIGEAFRDHLARPLPGGSNRSDHARVEWAKELSRQLSQRQFEDVVGTPLEGDLQPQTGAESLRYALTFVALSGAVFAVLLALWLRGP